MTSANYSTREVTQNAMRVLQAPCAELPPVSGMTITYSDGLRVGSVATYSCTSAGPAPSSECTDGAHTYSCLSAGDAPSSDGTTVSTARTCLADASGCWGWGGEMQCTASMCGWHAYTMPPCHGGRIGDGHYLRGNCEQHHFETDCTASMCNWDDHGGGGGGGGGGGAAAPGECDSCCSTPVGDPLCEDILGDPEVCGDLGCDWNAADSTCSRSDSRFEGPAPTTCIVRRQAHQCLSLFCFQCHLLIPWAHS